MDNSFRLVPLEEVWHDLQAPFTREHNSSRNIHIHTGLCPLNIFTVKVYMNKSYSLNCQQCISQHLSFCPL